MLVWHWLIIIYLFLGGLGGGLFAVIAGLEAYGLSKPFNRTISWGANLAWIFVLVGIIMLVLELGRPERGIYTMIYYNFSSPMTWGVIVLVTFTIFGFLYGLAHTGFLIEKLLPPVWNLLRKYRGIISVVGGTFGIMTGIYTGILLTYARFPLWNSSFLPILFLISALATGFAVFLFLAKSTKELEQTSLEKSMPQMVVTLGAFELAAVFMYVNYLPSTTKAQLLTLGTSNGSLFLIVFLIGGVLVGEIGMSFAKMKTAPRKSMIYIAVFLTLVGGFALRYVIVTLGPTV